MSDIDQRTINIQYPMSSTSRRFIKKLVRIGNATMTTTKRPRRRLLVKKRKLLNTMVVPSGTSTRKRIKITKLRLRNLPIEPTKLDSTISTIPSTTTKMVPLPSEMTTTENFETTEQSTTTTTSSTDKMEEPIETSTDGTTNPPKYEPFFPELTEPFDAPIILLKTTVLSTIEFNIKTMVRNRLRTYTYVVTRINGAEHIVTSTTKIKPHTDTLTLTEPMTRYTTLTLLDLDVSTTPPSSISTTSTTSTITTSTSFLSKDQPQMPKLIEEARYNLATRIMSNGVEVIVAGDKSTIPGEPDIKRVLPSTIYKPITLKPSTLSDHMMMVLPPDASNNINQFVTKTCLTTFTYMTTFLESGTTTVSSHEQVVSNIATEERNTGKILPTPAMGITLTQYPNLSVGTFPTTYTYLNTIIDGEQPIVVTSKHTVTNTVTAPDDYLSLLVRPSELVHKDTNTYFSTMTLTKTLYEDDQSQLISTNEVVTQVVITESVPPKGTSVMTSYIALDVVNPTSLTNLSTTDVVKTYYVTYTYYNTVHESGTMIVGTNVSTSSDVVTEKIYLQSKKTVRDDIVLGSTNWDWLILATKTYHTTFTYFTTLLQEDEPDSPTVISSRTKIVENIVTETLEPALIAQTQLDEWQKLGTTITDFVRLKNGQELEVTASYQHHIKPTKVSTIESTALPLVPGTKIELEPSSTTLEHHISGTGVNDETSSTKMTPILKKTTKIHSGTTHRTTTKTRKSSKTSIKPTKVVGQESVSIKSEKKPEKTVKVPSTNQVPDLLGLGSININALTPVLNAMAGLIETNLKSKRRNDSATPKPQTVPPPSPAPPLVVPERSPIYIPVGDIDISESQNVATFHLQEPVDWKNQKPQESPLLNGGIPISPGDVITTNSDVIVGKPGRILPRIPIIPLNQVIDDEVPFDMKPPPPVPDKLWPKRHPDRKTVPLRGEKPIRDDYVGPVPPYVPKDKVRAEKHKPIPLNHHFNPPIRPSILNEPMVLPEIIERSTGQPLLVNIQPSQVAFVNIPHNRTTALIYGGSTEPHRNGQYFDDPSPYPQPEFSAIESFDHKGVPQFASIYQDTHQKQVGGTIKVIPISVEPHQRTEENMVIAPTKPQHDILVNFGGQQEVNVKVPPISFGLVQQNDEINAHIINHGDLQFDSPPLTYEVINNQQMKHEFQVVPHHVPTNPTYHVNSIKTHKMDQVPQPNHQHHHQIAPQSNLVGTPIKVVPSSKIRPYRPNNQIADFMTPPPLRPTRPSSKYHYSTTHSKVVPIPLTPVDDYDGEDADDDDLINEDGEVIQESNSRPLRPGQVPHEILKIQSSTTTSTEKYFFNQSNIRFPIEHVAFPNLENEIGDGPRPIVSVPRPFSRPEPQSNFYENSTPKSTNRPVYSGTISPITYHPTRLRKRPTRPHNFRVPPIKVVPSEKLTTNRPDIIVNQPGMVQFIASDSYKPIITGTTHEPKIDEPIDIITERPIKFEFPTHSPTRSTTKKSVPSTKNPVPITTTPKSRLKRPQVTSLPIDVKEVPNLGSKSQTEKPFIFDGSQSLHELLNREKVSSTTPIIHLDIMTPPPLHVMVPKQNHSFAMKPVEIMVPPPPPPPRPPIIKPEVIGMNPPPLSGTTTTSTTTTTSSKPIFSLELDPPKLIQIKPKYPTTTTMVPPKNEDKITVPPLEIIIGNPTTESTRKIFETIVPTPVLSTKTDMGTILTHHAGNEIRIIDSTIIKNSTTVLPTQHVTHTQTATVTVTETTIVETSSGTTATLTLLVTKTEKSTVLDTVTKFHTLVQPTNIIETVTTTIKQNAGSLYPPEVYGSTYPSIQVRPTLTYKNPIVLPTVTIENTVHDADDDDLNDFIINETDPPVPSEKVPSMVPEENESIFVVMTDKNRGSIIKVPPTHKVPSKPSMVPVPPPSPTNSETQQRDEMLETNDVNHILLGGVLIANRPSLEVPKSDRCEPECKPSRNDVCQKVDGTMRCVCRPGFARMFPDRPCKPTYTYSLEVVLERMGSEKLQYQPVLSERNSSEYQRLAAKLHDALDRTVMQSDLRDIYHGVHIDTFTSDGTTANDGIRNRFYLQLSDNTDEKRLEEVFDRYLRHNNYSLGGTETYAARAHVDVADFDECAMGMDGGRRYHDCSENAKCFNLRGTYTCSCKEGFADLSENTLYPGRICSADLIGCERCNYHGTCYARGDDQSICECFHWYAGDSCHINLKVLLIALGTIGTLLLVLLFICIILTCCTSKKSHTNAMSFLPQRVTNGGTGGTIDRRAMIQDTSSEDSRSETNPPYVPRKKVLKGALKKSDTNGGTGGTSGTLDQKDRSLTVMIPRAKYHPVNPLSNYTSFDACQPSVPPVVTSESKLLSYLDAGPTPDRTRTRRYSRQSCDDKLSRKTSGALVSAGFEVSATVNVNGCGTEADRSENATLIQKISADLLSSSTGTRSQFNTFRKTFTENSDAIDDWLEITPRINTVSEARSCDETTVPPAMKSFRGDFDSKPSSQHPNDEAGTMAERDLGSTFLLPHTHLYKPDRGSDISGFESL